MSNIDTYKEFIEESLHSRIFQNDPRLDRNIYVDSRFGGTLQQLAIVRNWSSLREKFSSDELWAFLKLNEYRPSKLVFDESGNTNLELYQQYYRRSLWLSSGSRIFVLGLIIVFLALLFVFWLLGNTSERPLNLLELIEKTTIAQQW